MTGHVAAPALEPEAKPATVSANTLTTLLRTEWKFDGLVVTDALDMQAVTKLYPAGEAAVRALEAGADLLLMPGDPREAVRAIVAAVRAGRVTQQRVDASALRILAAKARLGLQRRKLVDIESVADSLATAEDNDLAASVAQRALTLVRNEGALLPLAAPERACWFLLSGGRFSTQGRELAEAVRLRSHAQVSLLDPNLPESEFDALAERARTNCDVAVVAAYALVGGGVGNGALPGRYPAFIEKLTATPTPVAFVSLGNPYLLRGFPNVKAYLAAFSTTTSTETAVARAVLGEVAISGKLPVTIPGFAKLGDGLKTEARSSGPHVE